jgi:hypothetical protein
MEKIKSFSTFVNEDGKSGIMTPEEVYQKASSHKKWYYIEDFEKELKAGISVEMEHTKDSEIAKRIALDHLSEDPEYYEKLAKAGLVDEPSALKHLE